MDVGLLHYLGSHDSVVAALLTVGGVALTLHVNGRQAEAGRRRSDAAEREKAAADQRREDKEKDDTRRADELKIMEMSTEALAETVGRLQAENTRLYNETQRLHALIDILHKQGTGA